MTTLSLTPLLTPSLILSRTPSLYRFLPQYTYLSISISPPPPRDVAKRSSQGPLRRVSFNQEAEPDSQCPYFFESDSQESPTTKQLLQQRARNDPRWALRANSSGNRHFPSANPARKITTHGSRPEACGNFHAFCISKIVSG